MSGIVHFVATVFFVTLVSSVSGCSTTSGNDGEQSVSNAAPEMISLSSKDNGEVLMEITDPDKIAALVAALENREQRFEKLLPFFEYRLDVTENGKKQTWKVNKAGYLQKSDSSELYKMDVSALFE